MKTENMEYGACIIGLGAMGMGTALSCVKAGIKTFGVDIVKGNLEKLLTAGAAEAGDTALPFVESLDAVMIMVVNSAQTRSILFDGTPSLADSLKKNTVVLLSATMSPQESTAIGERLERCGLLVLDAPMSGGAAKAASGELTIMASGTDNAFAKASPLLDAVAAKVYKLGQDLGLGSTVKIIHQLLAGVHIAAAAEAMAMAAKSGVDLSMMYEVVTNAAGNSWMFENRMRHVLDGDYTPLSKVDIFVKDLGLVTETGRALKFPLPLASAALAMFTNASGAGFGNEDDSAVIKTYNGITLPEKKLS